MIIDELFEGPQQCPECGGISFSDLILAEKKDACYYKVKASAKVWPSAYASGRLVQCRKKGAANYGNKSEGVAEGSVYKKDQDLSSISTQELEAFVKKHWAGGIPTWGQGESVKRAMRELRRRQKPGVAEAKPTGSRRDPLDLPPLEGPGGGGGAGGPSRSGPLPFTPVKIPGTNINIPGVTQSTSPPPVVTRTPNINKQLDPALDVPAYVRKGLPDPVTTPVGKPKITVRPGETQSQAMQRTQTEKEFGKFLKGQSGQTFGAGAGRGTVNPPAAKSNAPKELTIDPNDPKTFTKQTTAGNPEMDKIMKKWDQEQRSTPASLSSPSKSKTSPSKFLQLFGPDKMDEASRKKRETPEVEYDDEYDAMVARVKRLAGLGPMKTVYDPAKRQYRNMPTAVQPKK